MNTFKKYAPLIGLAIVGVLLTAAACGVLEVGMASLILSSIGLLYEVSKCTKNGVKKTLEAYARVRTA